MPYEKNSILDRIKSTLGGVGRLVREEQFETHLDQAIRATDEKIKKAQQDRNAAKASRLHAHRRALDEKAQQRELEATALEYLRSRQKAKARTLSFDIAKVIEARAKWEADEARAKFDEQAKSVDIDMLEAQLRRLKYQLGVFRAAANLQRTQESLVNASQGATISSPAEDRKEKKTRLETPQDIMTRLETLVALNPTAKPASPATTRKPRRHSPGKDQ